MDQPAANEMPRRRGILETIKRFVTGVVGATAEKVEEVSAEVQHRTLRIMWMIVWTLVAATSIWLAVCFAMLTVIFGFGLPPRYAFGIPALVFLAVGAVAVLMFQKAKGSRRRRHTEPD
jgi:uncharacterized membrane protein YqjE